MLLQFDYNRKKQNPMKPKQIGKQMQTVYINKKIKFKKQSETIEAAIKDKEIEKKKKAIIGLLKVHTSINDELSATKVAYQLQKQSYEKKHSELINEKSIVYSSLFRLKIRKYRIEALENPEIKKHFQSELRKYLNGWVQVNKHRLVVSLGGIQNYKIARKFAFKIERNYLLRPQLRKIVLFKHQTIFNECSKIQPIAICVKTHQLNQKGEKSYKIQIYSTKGNYFFITRILSQQEYEQQICKQSPLKNLHILIRKKSVIFLDEYFNDEANVKKIERILKIYKFQIDVLREKKKYVFFKVLHIKNIFQSVYQVQGYKNLELQVLLGVKKKEIVRSNEEELSIYANGASRKMNRYGREKGIKQTQQKIEKRFFLYCQPIVNYDSKYMFRIQDENLLKNCQKCPQNFMENFKDKYMIQLVVKKSTLKPEESMPQQRKQKNHKNQYNFQEGLKRFEKQIINPKIVKVIDFSSPINLKKLIKLQSLIKMRLLKKKYQSDLKRLKEEGSFWFCCKIEGNIMICSFIKREKLIYFVQCLSLSADRKRERNQYLQYKKKYWKLAEEFMKSQQIVRISKKYLVWEIEEQISVCFEEIIQRFEEQEQIINEMKPIKALNRLRRLFIRAILRGKRKLNIRFVKKIEKQFGTLVLILRKSPYLKNIIEAQLYVLKTKQKKSQNRVGNKQVLRSLDSEKKLNRNKTTLKDPDASKEKKSYRCIESQDMRIRYQPISMFAENVHKFVTYMKETSNFQSSQSAYGRLKKVNQKCVQSEFYITETYFLLKPLHVQYISGSFKFIQRFASISLLSDEILNQMQNSSFFKNAGQSFVRDQIRNTLLKEKSILRGSKISTASIVFENSQSFPEIQNSSKNLIFYSLYKDKSSRFFLELFILAENSTTSAFKQVVKQQISRKQIATSSWTFVYKIIATWAQNSGRRINYEEYFSLNRRDRMGYYYPVSNKNETSAGDSQNLCPEPETI